jgi:hypothetical protein
MKYSNILAIISLAVCLQASLSGQAAADHEMTVKTLRGPYISINPISLTAFIPSVVTNEYLPYAQNLESGVSLASGYFFNRFQLEGRVVIGTPSALIFCPQLHAGFFYFPFLNRERKVIPIGIGFFVRSWDTYYTHSNIHFLNLSPHPGINYVVRKGDLFFDFRAGWDFAVFTWSNLEHSNPTFAFTRFPPTFSLNIGYFF